MAGAQDVPPLRDTSIFTLPVRPVEVHWMVRLLPMGQVSPPFGAVTARLPPPIVTFALLASTTVGSVRLVMRMRAWVVAGTGHGPGEGAIVGACLP